MILERLPSVQELSASEKWLLLNELWEEFEANPATVPITPEIIAELDARMAEFDKNPDHVTTWEAVKKRLQGSRG